MNFKYGYEAEHYTGIYKIKKTFKLLIDFKQNFLTNIKKINAFIKPY